MSPSRAVAQLGSAPALGAGGRQFKSGQPDQKNPQHLLGILACGRSFSFWVAARRPGHLPPTISFHAFGSHSYMHLGVDSQSA